MNLETLIDQVRTEAAHLSGGANPASDAYRQQATMALFSRVPVLLSSAAYSAHLAGGRPPRGLDNTLAIGAGICGDHVALGTAVLEALSIPNRDVQVFYRDSGQPLNHTVVEVEWGGKWRMVDLTWGFIPHMGELQEAIGFEEASRHNIRIGLHHSAIPWRLAVENVYDIFGYLSDPRDGLLVGGVGEISVELTEGQVPLHHGRTTRAGSWPHLSGRTAHCSLRLLVPAGSWRAEIKVEVSRAGTLVCGDAVLPVEPDTKSVVLEAGGPTTSTLSFETAGKTTGHVVVLDMRANSTEPIPPGVIRIA